MSRYVLSCCTTADLSKEHFEQRDISYICFHYSLDDVPYFDDLGQSMNLVTFYEKMAAGADTKTSQINADEFYEYFKGFLEKGKDILHLSLSSGISGVINSANIAAAELREEFPDRQIFIVDSLAASSGYGLIMDRLADLRDEGKSVLELYQYIIENRRMLHHWFFVTDLAYLVKGGRVSKAAGALGGALGICPLLNVDYLGRLITREKVRPKKKVFEATIKRMIEHADNGTDYNGKCYISHSNCPEDARLLADMVEETFPNLNGRVEINYIGTTIGSHTGPGTVALFFWGDERID